MEQYIMKGGKPLCGEVTIGGAKNAALGIIAAAMMADEPVYIENIPEVRDIHVLFDAVRETGAIVEARGKQRWMINGGTATRYCVDTAEMQKLRGGYYLLGALLGKYHQAEVVMPGGCNLGSRPIDQHLKGFRALGAKVTIRNGNIHAQCDKLVGANIYFDVSTVGATINVMMAAALAKGRTVLENAAKEPHVVDVANFLNSMGAKIKGAGTDVIRIDGVPKLHGTDYAIIPDQIEAGTFMMAAAATRGNVTVKNVIPKHLDSISSKLREIGCEIIEYDDAVQVIGRETINPTQIKTLPYPGFPTDMQPQVAVVLALASGTSMVIESIFDNRFKYVDELRRMGATIQVEGSVAVIDGVSGITGAKVFAPDLRAGAALVIAGLSAEGVTIVSDIRHIERGYENFVEKLRGLGAEIEKIDDGDDRGIQRFKLKASSL